MNIARTHFWATVATVATLALWFACAAPAFARPQANSEPAPSTPAAAPAGSNAQTPEANAPALGAACNAPANSDERLPQGVRDQLARSKSGNGPKFTLQADSREDYELSECFRSTFGPDGESDCRKIIDIYKTGLIPRAEQAKFPKNKAKYLARAYEAVGNCQMTQGRYIDAEQSFRTALTHAAISPGKDDEQYPGLLTRLGDSQFKQDHWKDAESSAAQSAALYQGRIDDYKKVLPKVTGEVAENIREAMKSQQWSRAVALSDLASLYSRDGDLDQAAKTIELSYKDAIAAGMTSQDLAAIVQWGAHIAELSGNAQEAAKWAARADTSAPPKGSQSQ